ncbi:stage V sporulation protein AE [Desulfofalx alkaliphila]|uniref:stage V sporulation protein AE n=1 Tax=Desulfofalx alkaliphila TaxID=105483 RepID=UPI0004E252BD|nr:stage V sporulation protein AE [Desulfofalx alkaliphila]
MADKKRVILITDGDRIAKEAVETAAKNIGARCISCSWGNPTRLTGEQLSKEIMRAPHDPVVVMLDDRGFHGEGPGESALRYIAEHPDIEVLGVVAVASNTEGVEGVVVDQSITNDGEIIEGPVDKDGFRCPGNGTMHGDTIEILKELDFPVVIGIGDIGKMCGYDDVCYGAPVTTKALQEVLNRSGYGGDRIGK